MGSKCYLMRLPLPNATTIGRRTATSGALVAIFVGNPCRFGLVCNRFLHYIWGPNGRAKATFHWVGSTARRRGAACLRSDGRGIAGPRSPAGGKPAFLLGISDRICLLSVQFPRFRGPNV